MCQQYINSECLFFVVIIFNLETTLMKHFLNELDCYNKAKLDNINMFLFLKFKNSKRNVFFFFFYKRIKLCS